MRKIGMLLLLAGALLAAEQGPIQKDELLARMPADLGSATVDVSSYPLPQQMSYKLFLDRCSGCHTPARAINSRIATREDWQHFVSLMHGRLLSGAMSESWKTDESRAIIDFLAYDSQVRKTAHPQEFESLQIRLAERFKLMQIEKERLAKKQPAKPNAPPSGGNR